MNLDRNNHPEGKSKYALINLRKVPGNPKTAEALADAIRANPACVEFGEPRSKEEFFVIKLRDANAADALGAYAAAASTHDVEYAEAVQELEERAGSNSPFCKLPD